LKIIQINYWIPINFKYWVMLYIVCSWMTTWLGNRKVTMPMLSQNGAMLILVNGVKQKISNTKNKKQGKLLTSFWWTSKCQTWHNISFFIYGIVSRSFKRIRRITWVSNPHVVKCGIEVLMANATDLQAQFDFCKNCEVLWTLSTAVL